METSRGGISQQWLNSWEKNNPEPQRANFETNLKFSVARILWLNKRFEDWKNKRVFPTIQTMESMTSTGINP